MMTLISAMILFQFCPNFHYLIIKCTFGQSLWYTNCPVNYSFFWSTNFFFGIPNIFLVNQIVFLVDQISERSGFEKFIMPIGLKGPGLKVWTQTVWGQWFLAVNHHNHKNWVPSILIHNLWLILIRTKQKKFKLADSKKVIF